MLVCGVDVIEIARVERALARRGQRFLARIYSPLEVAVSRGRSSELAARFAAKEAVSKALGVGIFGSEGLSWREVEVLPDRRGRPLIYLYGKAQRRAAEMGVTEVAVSLTHDGGLAVAMVVAQGSGPTEPLDPATWRQTLADWVSHRHGNVPASHKEGSIQVEKWKVSCLEAWDEEVKRIVLQVAPPEFEVTFASSYDPAEQYALGIQGDFILTGWAPVPAKMIEDAPRLRMVHKWGAGYDKIDLAAARRRGIPVLVASGANASPVAEHAIALMLAVYRRIPYVDKSLRKGLWLKQDMRSVCRQLKGKTVGLLGLGNIGRQVARKIAGFEVNVIYYDVRRADEATEKSLALTYVTFEDLLAKSDIVSVHVPLLDSTRNLLNAANIAKMKDGAVIINTSRGGVVDEKALYDALVSGKLFGAGLDTHAVEPPAPDNPLYELDQVVLSPHTGAVVVDNVADVTIHVFENFQRLLRGEPLPREDRVA
jgi:D-3-phosphoglycerate dehydrogenase